MRADKLTLRPNGTIKRSGKITVGLKALRRQIRLCDETSTKLFNDADYHRNWGNLKAVAVAKRKAEDMNGVAELLSELNAQLLDQHPRLGVAVYRGVDE